MFTRWELFVEYNGISPCSSSGKKVIEEQSNIITVCYTFHCGIIDHQDLSWEVLDFHPSRGRFAGQCRRGCGKMDIVARIAAKNLNFDAALTNSAAGEQ
jgi:hypothetical protein